MSHLASWPPSGRRCILRWLPWHSGTPHQQAPRMNSRHRADANGAPAEQWQVLPSNRAAVAAGGVVDTHTVTESRAARPDPELDPCLRQQVTDEEECPFA